MDHPVADELERASAWLDAHPELLEEVAADLGARSGSGRGRRGLSCETVLRCALLKHLRRETYRGLEFILRDSLSARRFARRAGGGRGGVPRSPPGGEATRLGDRVAAQLPERYGVVYGPLLDASPVSVEPPSDKPYCERGCGIRDASGSTW